jgi:hypothetical protein
MMAEHRHLVDQGAKLVELRLDYINGEVNLKRLIADRPGQEEEQDSQYSSPHRRLPSPRCVPLHGDSVQGARQSHAATREKAPFQERNRAANRAEEKAESGKSKAEKGESGGWAGEQWAISDER